MPACAGAGGGRGGLNLDALRLPTKDSLAVFENTSVTDGRSLLDASRRMLHNALPSAFSGAVFGAALTASRVYLPSVIIDQMRLTDSRMLQTFLTAVSASAFVMWTFERVSNWTRPVRGNSTFGRLHSYEGNIVGGALIGLGMSLAGACPGTVIIQLAQGIPSAQKTMCGALLGGVVFSRYGNILYRHPDESCEPQSKATIPGKLNIPEWSLFVAFGGTLAVLGLVNFGSTASEGISPAMGGLLISFAQAASVVMTSNTLGASAVYDQLGRYFWHTIGSSRAQKPASPPNAIFFAAGMVGGSLLLTALRPSYASVGASALPLSTARALLGGFALSFGARCAGGCTSGHGLSGIATMSYSSLITVAAMFGTGIAASAIL